MSRDVLYHSAVQAEIREILDYYGGMSERLSAIIATLKRKLQGHWNYFGVIGNSEQTWNFAWFARKLVYKWLNRRSQRKSFTVASFVAAWERWRMPDPHVIEVPLPRTR